MTGSVDDVRLYDHALTPADVQQLFDQPVFKLGFDDTTNLFKDTSPFATSITCSGTQCPGRWAGAGWLWGELRRRALGRHRAKAQR